MDSKEIDDVMDPTPRPRLPIVLFILLCVLVFVARADARVPAAPGLSPLAG